MVSHALNKTNAFLNSLSGNYLPVKSKAVKYSMLKISYIIFTWIMLIIFSVTTSVVIFLIPSEIALQNNTACTAMVIGGLIMAIYVNARFPLLKRLAIKMQEISIDNNEFKKAISQKLDPISEPIKIYVVCSIFSPTIWNALTFTKLFNHEIFNYEDFNVPAYFPGQPFDRKYFSFAIFVQVIGCFYSTVKKFSIDVYVINIIALLTAQYKYLKYNLANIFNDGRTFPETRDVTEDRLKTWIRHHQAVLTTSQMFREFSSLYVLVTFINCTFSFCFLAFMIIKIPLTVFEKFIILMYAGGCLIQLYMLCYCVQEFLDSSVSVTTRAFHCKWFTCHQSTQKLFSIIIMADRIRARLSAFGIVDLSLATFTQIINHAYSGCLLLQNAE